MSFNRVLSSSVDDIGPVAGKLNTFARRCSLNIVGWSHNQPTTVLPMIGKAGALQLDHLTFDFVSNQNILIK